MNEVTCLKGLLNAISCYGNYLEKGRKINGSVQL